MIRQNHVFRVRPNRRFGIAEIPICISKVVCAAEHVEPASEDLLSRLWSHLPLGPLIIHASTQIVIGTELNDHSANQRLSCN